MIHRESGAGVLQVGARTERLVARARQHDDSDVLVVMPMWSVADKDVVTIEGLGTAERPHPLQRAFISEQAMQCGYCVSGILISAAALLKRNPSPTEAEVRTALDRNLCRCGSHNRMAVMTEKRVRHLPVIDQGKLIGILSIGDLVKNIISKQKFVIDQLVHFIHC